MLNSMRIELQTVYIVLIYRPAEVLEVCSLISAILTKQGGTQKTRQENIDVID